MRLKFLADIIMTNVLKVCYHSFNWVIGLAAYLFIFERCIQIVQPIIAIVVSILFFFWTIKKALLYSRKKDIVEVEDNK